MAIDHRELPDVGSGAVEIRPMTRRDIRRVAEIEAQVYPQPWSPEVFFDELSLANRRYLVAEVDGEVVGYGGIFLIEDDAHVTTLAVDPTARRHRIGTRLMLALADVAIAAGASHLTLEVRVSNHAAQRLYRRFGFAPVGMRKNYYRDEDALVMWAIDVNTPEYQERLEAIRRRLEEDDR